MGVYNFFKPQSTLCLVSGKTNELVVIGRASRSEQDWKFNNSVKCIFPPNTQFAVGDCITADGNKYFITAMYRSKESDIEGKMIKTNAEISILKMTKLYNASGVFIGYSTPPIIASGGDSSSEYDSGLIDGGGANG